MSDIAKALRVILAESNKSQSVIARQCGVRRSHISGVCNGHRTPSWNLICAISKASDVLVSDFVKGGEE